MSTNTITQASAILGFYKGLNPDFQLPSGITIMNPYLDKAAWKATQSFYEKFYSDFRPRHFIFGINPGRFGAGVTGVPFTDPLQLEKKCGIANGWEKKAELSGQFIYDMIDLYGGVKAFYRDFFITGMSPLGFTWNGKNLNYYDNKELLRDCEPFILDCIRQQMATILTYDVCYCLGEGENYKQFRRINEQYHFFKEIIPLPHPRWVMQYRRKQVGEFAALYVEKFKNFSQ